MALDALRVNQQQPLFGFDKVPATEQQAQLLGNLLRNRGVSAPTIGQGIYDAYSAPISTQNQFADAQKKARDYQTNQNFISAAGNAINTGENVADIMGLDEDSITRLLVENADLITGLSGLGVKGIKRIAGSDIGKKFANAIIDKKRQLGESLDNIYRDFSPKYSFADDIPMRDIGGDIADNTIDKIDPTTTLGGLGSFAVRQGADNTPTYHGTPTKWNSPKPDFDALETTGKLEGPGLYLTNNIKHALKYSNRKPESPMVYKFDIPPDANIMDYTKRFYEQPSDVQYTMKKLFDESLLRRMNELPDKNLNMQKYILDQDLQKRFGKFNSRGVVPYDASSQLFGPNRVLFEEGIQGKLFRPALQIDRGNFPEDWSVIFDRNLPKMIGQKDALSIQALIDAGFNP